MSLRGHLKEKIETAALNFLNDKTSSHSKSAPLMKTKLKCENYIKDRRFIVDEVQLLFMLRSMQFPVKNNNFKNKYRNTNLLCELCKLEECTEVHLTLGCSTPTELDLSSHSKE